MYVICWRYVGQPVWRLYSSDTPYWSKDSVLQDVSSLEAYNEDKEYKVFKLTEVKGQ